MQKIKKRRKINRRNVLIAVVCGCILLGLTAWGVLWANKKIYGMIKQKNMKEDIAAVIEKHEDFVKSLDSVQQPSEISSETFQSLKQMALTDTDFSLLDQYKPDEKVSDEYYKQVMDLKNLTGNPEAASLFLNIGDYSEDILTFYLRDTDRYEFVKAYPERSNYQSGTPALSENLNEVPGLIQWDLRWGYYPYGDLDVAYAGCAPTALAMVISYLNQDPMVTPNVVARHSEDAGMYVLGVGTSNELLTEAADYYGIQSESVNIDEESVKAALADGKILILSMMPGKFTTTGHFIVAYKDENGQMKIHDPNSLKRSSQLWDYSEVLSESNAVWAYSK